MSIIRTEWHDLYWKNFDTRYHAVHPNLKSLKTALWELPQWITWLGGVLESRGYTSLEALDLYSTCGLVNGIDWDIVHKVLSNHQADVYLFSPLTPNLEYSIRIAEIAKELYPACTTIFGGVIASPLCEVVVQFSSVDYVIVDRAEYALPNLLDSIKNNGAVSTIGNLVYQNKTGKIVKPAFIYPPMHLSDIPFPKVDLFPSDVGNDIRYLRIEYARGCPFKCDYCSTPVNKRKPMYFPIDRVKDEIDAYRSHYGKHHYIYFGDSTFTLNPQRTLDLCVALQSKGDVLYDCQTRLDKLKHPDLPKALFNSGCRWLEIGIESASMESRKIYKPYELTLDNKTIENVLVSLRDNGIPVCSYILIGLPNETLDDMKRTIEWISSLIVKGLLQASFISTLVPYPGTKMYENPEIYGMTIHHHRFRQYREDSLAVYDTKFAKSEEIYQVFLEGLKEIGEAMSHKPYLGDFPDKGDEFGTFWMSV